MEKKIEGKGGKRTLLLPPPRSPHCETLSPSLFHTRFFRQSNPRRTHDAVSSMLHGYVPLPPRCSPRLWSLVAAESPIRWLGPSLTVSSFGHTYTFFANLSSHKMISPGPSRACTGSDVHIGRGDRVLVLPATRRLSGRERVPRPSVPRHPHFITGRGNLALSVVCGPQRNDRPARGRAVL